MCYNVSDMAEDEPKFDARLAEGVAYFEQMLQLMPEDRVTLEFLVVAYEQLDRHEDAQKALVSLTKILIKEHDTAALEGLLPRLEALLGRDDTYMELTSPGTDRNIKNAAEFALFKGTEIRVWDKNLSDWVSGTILGADKASLTLECGGESKVYKYEDIAKAKFLYS